MIDGAGQSHTIVENPLFLQVAETNKRHVLSHRKLNRATRKPWLAGAANRKSRKLISGLRFITPPFFEPRLEARSQLTFAWLALNFSGAEFKEFFF
jgi:hypothetical protein